MTEGWYGDDYLILFARDESASLGRAYGLPEYLPGFDLVGLSNWEQLIVVGAAGTTFAVPAVPISERELEPLALPAPPSSLSPDPSRSGQILWRIQPIALGGDPESVENMTWVTLEQHSTLVRWCNDLYREVAQAQGRMV